MRRSVTRGASYFFGACTPGFRFSGLSARVLGISKILGRIPRISRILRIESSIPTRQGPISRNSSQ